MNSLKTDIHLKLEQAGESLSNVLSPADIEVSMCEILCKIRDDKVSPNVILALLKEYIETGSPGEWEIWQFLLHALRWTSLKDFVEAEYEYRKNNPRTEPIVRELIAACSDDWEDAEIYNTFNASK